MPAPIPVRELDTGMEGLRLLLFLGRPEELIPLFGSGPTDQVLSVIIRQMRHGILNQHAIMPLLELLRSDINLSFVNLARQHGRHANQHGLAFRFAVNGSRQPWYSFQATSSSWSALGLSASSWAMSAVRSQTRTRK